jgi:hypothetical protein
MPHLDKEKRSWYLDCDDLSKARSLRRFWELSWKRVTTLCLLGRDTESVTGKGAGFERPREIHDHCGLRDESSLRGFLTGAAVVRKGKEKARQSQEWKQKWQVRRLRRQTSEVEGKERGCLV